MVLLQNNNNVSIKTFQRMKMKMVIIIFGGTNQFMNGQIK